MSRNSLVDVKLSRSKQLVVVKDNKSDIFYAAVHKPAGLETCNLIFWPIAKYNIKNNTVTLSIARGLLFSVYFDLPNFGRVFNSSTFVGFFYAQITNAKQLQRAMEMLRKIEKSYYI